MKIYECPKCAVKDCQERAFCIYSGVWVCGKHLEIAHKKEQTNKLRGLMEITE
jgi:hypothetical protein